MSVMEETVQAGAGTADSLFNRIGGEPAVNAAVELFYKKVVADPLLQRFFDGINLRQLKKKQKAFLTLAFGGPDRFNGQDLTTAHARLVNIGLGDEHFNAVAGHLLAALNELGVAEDLTNEITERCRLDRPN